VRYLVATAAFFILCLPSLPAADRDSDDTPKAAATRKKLKQKVECDYKDTPLRDVVDDLKDQIKGLQMQIDSKGGVSRNQAITYQGKGVTLEDALDQMFKKNGLGYIVISQKNNAYDGSIKIIQGKERGYPLKKD
jgi:hypothetical protein